MNIYLSQSTALMTRYMKMFTLYYYNIIQQRIPISMKLIHNERRLLYNAQLAYWGHSHVRTLMGTGGPEPSTENSKEK